MPHGRTSFLAAVTICVYAVWVGSGWGFYRAPSDLYGAVLSFGALHVLIPGLALVVLARTNGLRWTDYWISSLFSTRRKVEVLAAMVIVVLVMMTYVPISTVLTGSGETVLVEGLEQRRPIGMTGVVAISAFVAASAAFSEEIFFRAIPRIIFRAERITQLRTVAYIVTSATIFAAIHLPYGIGAAIAVGYMGVLAAFIFILTNNLWYLLIGHFILDFILALWRHSATGLLPV